MQRNIKLKKELKNNEFNSIFANNTIEKYLIYLIFKRNQNNLIKSYLEDTRLKDDYYSKKKPNQIQLSFPKDFNRRLDDTLKRMRDDYSEILDGQNAKFRDKITNIFSNVESIKKYIDNIKCKNENIVLKMAPTLTSTIIVNSPELIEMIIDDLVEEETLVQTELEKLSKENKDYIEFMLKKNRLKKQIMDGTQLGAWRLLEELEMYKKDIAFS